LTNNLKRVDDLVSNENIALLFSLQLLDEFIEVAKRPKFETNYLLSDLETYS